MKKLFTYLTLIIFTVCLSCKKDEAYNSNFLEGKWRVEKKGFYTHSTNTTYTFYENNKCDVGIAGEIDSWGTLIDTTIYKTYSISQNNKLLTLLDADNPKNNEQYEIKKITKKEIHLKYNLGTSSQGEKKLIKE